MNDKPGVGDKTVIPASLFDKMHRARVQERTTVDQNPSNQRRIDNCVESVRRAAGVIQAQSSLISQLEAELSNLMSRNSKLETFYEEARKAMSEMKAENSTQVSRAEKAEGRVQQLQVELQSMTPESEFARLTSEIEAAFASLIGLDRASLLDEKMAV